MPAVKTPRRKGGNTAAPTLTDQQARELAADVCAKYPTIDRAEASPEWRELHAKIARMIMARWRSAPVNSTIYTIERARGIARLYLTRPHLLPGLPPSQTAE